MRRPAASLAFAFGLASVLTTGRAFADDAPPPPSPAVPTVLLHVSSPSPVTVQREDTGEVVCESPCDAQVPATARYRISGAAPFVLAPGSSARADLHVRPGARGVKFWAGVGVLGAGAALLATGAVVLANGYANSGPVPGNDGEETDNRYIDAMTIGTALALGGVVASLWGGATVLSNLDTTVRGDVQKRAPARGNAPVPPRTAVVIPILGGTF